MGALLACAAVSANMGDLSRGLRLSPKGVSISRIFHTGAFRVKIQKRGSPGIFDGSHGART